jgi:hypothetical protein
MGVLGFYHAYNLEINKRNNALLSFLLKVLNAPSLLQHSMRALHNFYMFGTRIYLTGIDQRIRALHTELEA